VILLNLFKPTNQKRVLFFLFSDVLVSLFTLFLAYNLRFNFAIPSEYFKNFFFVFIYLTTLKIIFFNYFHIYNISWRFFSLYDAKKLFFAHLIAYTILTLTYYAVPTLFIPFPRSVIIIDLFLSTFFIGLLRILKRLIIENGNDYTMKKTLLIGVSSFAQTLIKEKNTYYVTAVVDTDEALIGTYISNIHVDSMKSLEKLLHTESIDSVIITKKIEPRELQNIYNRCSAVGVKNVKVASVDTKDNTLKNIGVEDLLARHPKDLDKKTIKSFLKDKTVLVTGAGGSIGSEICRQCEKYGVKKLILLDHGEYNLYAIEQEIQAIPTVAVLESIRDLDFIDATFAKYKPEIVIHAAAYKHVPLVEENIHEAILNNIVGTKNVINTAIKYKAEKFVMISTDKAVRPTNVMGTTKRICELYAQNSNGNSTDIVAVRFGNVLGSSGSVIPKFKKQIEAGGPITVTHPDITRYFMLIPEACELVLQAGAIGTGGEIFILDMGNPIKIVDLAQKMIEFSGRDDVEIVFSGLRPGEKLYEELLIDKSDAETEYKSITVAKPTQYSIEKLENDIDELLKCRDKIAKLKEIVPEFEHKLNDVK
jgi:UDP-N-acetyl-D-glucosamine 4,6-dehydratase